MLFAYWSCSKYTFLGFAIDACCNIIESLNIHTHTYTIISKSRTLCKKNRCTYMLSRFWSSRVNFMIEYPKVLCKGFALGQPAALIVIRHSKRLSTYLFT